jgi:hypothetical protein
MRKPVLFAFIALVVVLLGALGVLYQRYQERSTALTDVRAAEEAVQRRYGDAINAIAEIQDSLQTIALGDTSVQLLSEQLRAERGLRAPDGNEALDRIAVLKAGLLRTKERIRELEASLKRSGVKAAGLERMIAGLKQSVSEKEGTIARLTGQVDSLNLRVTDLAATVSQNEQTIAAQTETLEERRRELGTVFYIVGTKRDLTTQGVLVAKGGVLGLGRTLAPSGRYDEAAFTPLDTDHESVVSIPAEKAQVLTAQPTGSYELRTVDGHLELRILDPLEFRKVKHLVIVRG